MSSALGYVAAAIHDALWDELSQFFAVLYNLVLAVLFASVILTGVLDLGRRTQAPYLFLAIGFAFVYAILKIMYTDDVHKHINDYAILGFLGGLATYIVGSAAPRLVANPVTTPLYRATVWISDSWIGAAMSLYATFRLARLAMRWTIDTVTFQPKIKVREV
ncbi:MAG: hypothetical protein HY059_18585 [Proteobacteria bacterium]|nr:hypothetical protein [Pseudomonadota bacterium]